MQMIRSKTKNSIRGSEESGISIPSMISTWLGVYVMKMTPCNHPPLEGCMGKNGFDPYSHSFFCSFEALGVFIRGSNAGLKI
jgi:hypothetical protein